MLSFICFKNDLQYKMKYENKIISIVRNSLLYVMFINIDNHIIQNFRREEIFKFIFLKILNASFIMYNC